jgi:type VI protein secretion system component Hcp
MRRVWKAGAVLAAVGLGTGAAVAVASVPGGDGMIHACVNVTTTPAGATVPRLGAANLTVIDPDAGQQCIPAKGGIPNQTEISWSVTGPQGPPGVKGPTGAPGAAGAVGATGATGTSGPAGHGVVNSVTIAPPTLGAHAKPIAEATVGSGNTASSFPVLAAEQANVTAPRTGSGKIELHDFSLAKRVDLASPRLLRLVATGTRVPKLTIQYVKPAKPNGGSGSKKLEYLTIVLNDVMITGYQSQGAGQGTVGETLSLSFSRIEYSYTAQDDKGAKKAG